MSATLQPILVLFFVAAAAAQGLDEPAYTLQTYIRLTDDNFQDRQLFNFSSNTTKMDNIFSEDKTFFEWEGYDGWFNNPAHPEWGGAG